MQQVLIDIHEGRITSWRAELQDAEERKAKLKTLNSGGYYGYLPQFQEAASAIQKDESQANDEIEEYRRALAEIHAWRPTTFEDYVGSHSAATGTPHNSVNAGNAQTGVPKPLAASTVQASAAKPSAIMTDPEGGATENSSQNDEVQSALRSWSIAMVSNDSKTQASMYAPMMDRYFLRTNVDNAFVRADKQKFLDRGNKITRFDLGNVTIEDVSPNESRVSLVKELSSEDGSGVNRNLIRSELRFQRTQNGWKISSERDFR